MKEKYRSIISWELQEPERFWDDDWCGCLNCRGWQSSTQHISELTGSWIEVEDSSGKRYIHVDKLRKVDYDGLGITEESIALDLIDPDDIRRKAAQNFWVKYLNQGE